MNETSSVHRGRRAHDDYGVSADGERFLVKLPVEQDSAPRLHVVTNWTSLLE